MRHGLSAPYTVYNLEVHKDHTYYVSYLGILVYNSCATPKGRTLTTHAQESLQRHGFNNLGDIDDVIDSATKVTTQDGGATVYIKRGGGRRRRYDIVIVGDMGIVTGLRNQTHHQLENLGRNHGFNPNP